MSSNSPASQVEATAALKALFTAFPAERGNGIGGAATYLMAVDGYSLPAIQKAVSRLIRGEFDWFGGRFLPTTAELSRACRYCEDLIAPPQRLALPAPGSEALTEDEVARRQALADRARERFGIKAYKGETVVDRDAIPEAKRAELDRTVAAVAERIKASGLPMLSDEAKALFREQAELAVPSPADQFDEWDQRNPSHLPRNEEAA